MIFLITYDRKGLLRDNTALSSKIKSFGSWWHHLDNTWIVQTNLNVNQIYNELAPYFLQLDKILIIEVNRNYFGWLKNEAWSWLKERFDAEENNNLWP